MLFFIFSFFIAAIGTQEVSRVLNPMTVTIKEKIETTHYQIGEDYTLILQYNSYPGVYALSLGKNIITSVQAQLPNMTYDPFTLPGCFPYDRRLIQKNIIEVKPASLFNLTSVGLFTSMYVRDNLIFLIRNDYQFFVVSIETNTSTKEIIGLKGVTQMNLIDKFQKEGFSNDLIQEQLIICSEKYQYCYIFSPMGNLVFNFNSNHIEEIKSFELQNKIYSENIHLDNSQQLLFICYGTEGVDVYVVYENGDLVYQVTINPKNGNFIQAKTNEEGTLLYVLDKQQGLFIYEIISQRDFMLMNFYIQVLNTQAFDFYQNTFFIVAQTQDQFPYALEVLVNFEQSKYYINEIYSKDMEIYDVYVGEYYAILIGSEVHRVIYHSIYNKFINVTEIPLYFQDFDLVNVEEYKPSWKPEYNVSAIDFEPFSRAAIQYKQAFMVGLSDDDLNVFAIKNLPPWIQCKASELNKTDYYLIMNSTDCATKSSNNDYSPFAQCVIYHNFSFEAKQIIFYEKDYPLAIILGSSLAGLILILLITAFCCKQQLQKRIDRMRIDNDAHLPLEEVDPIPNSNHIV